MPNTNPNESQPLSSCAPDEIAGGGYVPSAREGSTSALSSVPLPTEDDTDHNDEAVPAAEGDLPPATNVPHSHSDGEVISLSDEEDGDDDDDDDDYDWMVPKGRPAKPTVTAPGNVQKPQAANNNESKPKAGKESRNGAAKEGDKSGKP